MELTFAGGAYETFSKNLNAQECVNFFTHIDQEGGVSVLSLRATPGLKEWCDTGEYAEVRGTHGFGKILYAVVGKYVYRVDSDGNSMVCTGTLETVSGVVSIDHNTTQVMIVDGVFGYIVTETTVTKITDEGFCKDSSDNTYTPKMVTYQDGYFIVSAEGTNIQFYSTLDDGTSWDSTENFTAEAYPDNTVAVFSDHRDVFVFGGKVLEPFYNSGGDPVFVRKPGTIQEVGLGARFSVAQLDNSLFFLTDKYQVARLQGYSPKAISNRAVEYQIAKYSNKSEAIGMGINIEGNSFYTLTFPSDDATWCFNAATGVWNQLMSFPSPYDHKWRGNCYAHFNDKHIIGDYKNGKLYEWDFDTYKENSNLIRRVRTAKAVKEDGKTLFHHQLEIFLEAGVGVITGQGSDPQAMLQWSDDGGHTWSSEVWRSAGKIGAKNWRAVWNRLGSSRQRNYRLIVTDPVKWVITGANLEVELGAS
jgi:hypothetical protein